MILHLNIHLNLLRNIWKYTSPLLLCKFYLCFPIPTPRVILAFTMKSFF